MLSGTAVVCARSTRATIFLLRDFVTLRISCSTSGCTSGLTKDENYTTYVCMWYKRKKGLVFKMHLVCVLEPLVAQIPACVTAFCANLLLLIALLYMPSTVFLPPRRTPGGPAGSHYTNLLILCHAGSLRVRRQARHPAAGASWLRAAT